jgi:hypothetical protein
LLILGIQSYFTRPRLGVFLSHGCELDRNGAKDGPSCPQGGSHREEAIERDSRWAPEEVRTFLTVSRPTLTFIAGANGSGKSTLTRWNSELFKETPLLDPDAVANTLQATASALFPVAAARRVLQSAREHLKEGESFAVETTLAGRNYLQMMLEARLRGFEIVLV